MENPSRVPVPLRIRLRFGRAAVQVVADAVGVDVLHIKGNAADPALRPGETSGTDVDILVRPAQVAVLDRELRSHGWRVYSTFVYGSPFEHAQTYLHDSWGYLDVHRWFPGIRTAPEAAFQRMWADRRTVSFAGVGCAVPDIAAQAALLVLNSARGGGDDADLARSWTDAAPDHRDQVQALVRDWQAQVAFAAATGELDRWKEAPDYRLWKVISEGGPRTAEWWARIRSAPSWGRAMRIALRAPMVNVEHLTIELGRAPTRLEIVAAFLDRPRRMVIETGRLLSRQRGAR